MRQGILVGGNFIIDHVKIIDTYPEQEKLVNILAEYSSNGGSAYNLLKGLCKLGVRFPLEAVGLLGDDERGCQIIEECSSLRIDTQQLRQTDAAATSYTDVMSVHSTGKRTFFHQRGANALLDKAHFNFTTSRARIFHLGYLLLLDQLDLADHNGVTGAAHVLKAASEAGFLTSADIVSENSDRFASIVPPALPYIDYLFVNEFEAGMLTGIATTTAGAINVSGCFQAASRIIEMGVRQWVILHFPEGVVAVSASGEQLFQPGLRVPADRIAGAVGAGDAFAAGVLMGLHDETPLQDCLLLGVSAAASSLFKATCSDGILPAADCLQLAREFGYREQPVAV
ncbi:MAG: carbohydrate kinase family protein [Candidatus Pseudobacter hemicellulosilyticus]|uniref:Carbohydrate kinase family protein n=1 Tax=Candidatus Pseudobacter hemicellulosilyticus TaxID=3121375 RepID=A0AAJ5WSM3_9BACT|nr:MAG: carbohydrate kinase family protein [Pseudobacter sp.]